MVLFDLMIQTNHSINPKLSLRAIAKSLEYTHVDVHEILPPFGRLDDKLLLFVIQSEAKNLEYTHVDANEILHYTTFRSG